MLLKRIIPYGSTLVFVTHPKSPWFSLLASKGLRTKWKHPVRVPNMTEATFEGEAETILDPKTSGFQICLFELNRIRHYNALRTNRKTVLAQFLETVEILLCL